MTIINAEKFLGYLIFSKHIDGLTCGEVKEAIEMCKVDDVLDKIRADVEHIEISGRIDEHSSFIRSGEHIKHMVIDIINKYKTESEEE